MSHPTSTLRLFHEAILDSLHALIRLHDFVLRYYQRPREQRGVLRVETLYQEYLVPFIQGQQKIAGNPEHGSWFERMTAARLALGRDILTLRGMVGANAHEFVFGVSIFFIRLWNRRARPAASENPPPIAGPWQVVLYSPCEEMDFELFLNEAHQCLHDYNPMPLHVELKLEYVKATEMLQAGQPAAENRIQREGDVWHLRYQDESGDYPVKGNQSIGWLAKLLAAPNRALTVADLRGDPEGKLAADAMLGAEPETDREGTAAIKRRLQEIADITAETGGSDSLHEEEAQLLGHLKEATWAKTLDSQLRRDHANIATQLRNFRRKLGTDMPQLAAHLKASLKLDFPEFGYYPPDPPPDWQF
jgi:hypothetical protein